MRGWSQTKIVLDFELLPSLPASDLSNSLMLQAGLCVQR